MTKRRIIRPAHRYDFAGFMNKLGGNPIDGKLTTGAFAGMNADLAEALPALGSAVGGVAGGLIGEGRTSPAGDVIGGLSKIASAIPGPWGAIAGAGLGVIGGLTNAAFGVKLNQENINAVNNNIGAMNNFQSNASSFDDLAQNINSQPVGMKFDQSFVGKNGWFNKGATKKFNQLQAQQDMAQQFVNNSLDNNMNNLINTQSQNLLANYAAKGGPLATNGADWLTGLNYIGAGGSHEQNPNGGIQQGIAPDGLPNLVEEGEVIWNNDYVFSKRLKVPKAVRNKYKLRGNKPLSFADAALQFNKEMEERPNDPISKRGRDSMLAKLADVQEEKRANIALKEQQDNMLQGMQPIIAANGGAIHIDKNKRGTFTAAASRHGKSVQEFASQVLANPENYSPAMRKKANFARNAAKWHSNGGHLYPNGTPIYGMNPEETYFMGDSWLEAPNTHTPLPTVAEANNRAWNRWKTYTGGNTPTGLSLLNIPPLATTPIVEPSGVINISPQGDQTSLNQAIKRRAATTSAPRNNSGSSWLTGLRYAPVVGSALGVFGDLLGITNRPDYSGADAILEASKGVRDVSFRPIGDYMAYNPFDRMFYLNQLNANAGASRRALANQSAGNRGTAMAGILASDNNMMNSTGQMARQAEEYNLAQRQKVADFNRATNMFNSEGFLKAQQANQGASEVRMRAAQAAAAMRDAIDQRIGAARSANLTNLFNNLGDIGWEEFNRNMVNSSPYLYYLMGRNGIQDYKGRPASKGGYITIKNKRRK